MPIPLILGRAATFIASQAGQAYMSNKIGQQAAAKQSASGQQTGNGSGPQVNPNANTQQFKMSPMDRVAAGWHSGRNEAGRPAGYSFDSLPTFAPEKGIEVPRLKFPL